MGDLTEVPVPTKFLFFLLGPVGQQSRHHEIGRSIATLMSDEVTASSLWLQNISRILIKLLFAYAKNKGADQLAGY